MAVAFLLIVSGSVGGCVGSLILYVGSEDSFVVVVNDLFYIVHAAVTDLYCVSVEDFAKLMVFREVFVYQREEFIPGVSAGVLAERWVQPEDVVALTVLAPLLVIWFIVKCVAVSTVVECFLVGGSCLVEESFDQKR